MKRLRLRRWQFLFVPHSWRVRAFKCCDFHTVSIQIGPWIWRRDA